MFIEKRLLKKITISQKLSIKKTLKIIDKSSLQIALVVNQKNQLIGTVTDGDIRRALIKGKKLNSTIKDVINYKPMYLNEYTSLQECIDYTNREDINHLPLVDKDKILKKIFILKNTYKKVKKIKNTFVIMAGGKGTRLGNLTKKTPKPLLKIGEKTLIEEIIDNAKKAGIKNFIITTFYLKKKILNFFKKKNYPKNFKFINEDKPSGTAGSLKKINQKIYSVEFPIIVSNCDTITDIDYKELIRFHKKNRADLTLCSKKLLEEVPYGIIESKKNIFTGIKEKPINNLNINAGIYVISKKCLDLLNDEKILDMNILIENLKKKNYKIIVFPIINYWEDFGSNINYLKKFNK